MQIEYSIKFQKDGFTITESIDTGGGAAASVKPGAPVAQNSLGASFQDSQSAGNPAGSGQGGGPHDRSPGGGPHDRSPGGGPADGAPITIIGPFIFLCRPHEPEADHGK